MVGRTSQIDVENVYMFSREMFIRLLLTLSLSLSFAGRQDKLPPPFQFFLQMNVHYETRDRSGRSEGRNCNRCFKKKLQKNQYKDTRKKT